MLIPVFCVCARAHVSAYISLCRLGTSRMLPGKDMSVTRNESKDMTCQCLARKIDYVLARSNFFTFRFEPKTGIDDLTH